MEILSEVKELHVDARAGEWQSWFMDWLKSLVIFVLLGASGLAAEDAILREIRDLSTGVVLAKKRFDWAAKFGNKSVSDEADYYEARARLASAKLRYLTGESTAINRNGIKQQAEDIEARLAKIVRDAQEKRQKEFREMMARQAADQRLDDISAEIERLQFIIRGLRR